jgi:DNA-binding IclR family transcriptional regulator
VRAEPSVGAVPCPRRTRGRLRLPSHLRELVPCHCTAAGKALLAGREPWREAVLSQPLQSFTDRTLTGPQWLRRELERTVARGYAIEDREYEPHARGLAAPIVSHDGETVAALGVVAPVGRLPAERYGEVAETVVRAARALSSELAPERREKPSARPNNRP